MVRGDLLLSPILHGRAPGLTPQAFSTVLATLSVICWITALSAPLVAGGGVGPLAIFASIAAALLCTQIDRFGGLTDVRRSPPWFAPVVAVAVAFLVGGLLTVSLNDLLASPFLRWWRGGAMSGGILFAAQAVIYLTRMIARSRGYVQARVVVIGEASSERSRLIEERCADPIATALTVAEPGDVGVIAARAAAAEFNEVYVLSDGQSVRPILDALAVAPVNVWVVEAQREGGALVERQIQAQRQVGIEAFAKRALDAIGAAACLIVLSPVLLLIAVAIRLESPGKAIFTQERFGYLGRTFTIWKFRSMRSDAADATGSQLTSRNDARVTRVGAFIRKTSIDELPQLVNILRGELSFVGPRPHPSGASANGILYDDLIPTFRARYRVRPGLTGLAQCSGLRGNTDTERKLFDRFEADMTYVENWSLRLDLVIILRTVGHLLNSENAY